MFSHRTDLPIELESSALVRFQDCDPYGHLNNARFVDYFMNARADQLRAHYDFDIFGWGKHTGENWVVSKTQIAYLWPAGIMEEVRIRTRLILADDHRLVVEGIMIDTTGKHVKALCWIEFTYVNMQTGRTAKHPDDLLAFLQSVEYEGVFGNTTFDERIGAVKTEIRSQSPSASAVPVAA